MTDVVPLDFASLRQYAIDEILASDQFADLDTSAGSPDVRLIEASAKIGALIAYHANRLMGSERWLKTAVLRRSVQNLLRLLGYTMSGPTPARCTETFTLKRIYPNAVTFPAGSIVSTEDGSITYELDSALTINAGNTTGSVAITEGKTHTEIYQGASVDDTPNGQVLALAQSPHIAGSETIVINGVIWSKVDNFLASTATSKHFVVDVDQSTDRANVIFGDGINGARPANGAQIVITYRVGGGKRGRVRRGRLTRLEGSFLTSGGTPVEVTVTNPVDSSGGDDRETVAHAKLAGPASLRGTNRTIAREDFEIHTMEVSGVARALCHTHNEDNTLPWLDHRVYVVPTDGGVASNTLLNAIRTYIENTKPPHALAALQFVSATYKSYTVSVTVRAYPGSDSAAITGAAIANVTALFSPSARTSDGTRYVLNFGEPPWRSKIIEAVQKIEGVKSVSLTSPASDVTPLAHEFPTLSGPVSVTVIVDTE